jgi:hypothetical protein
VKIKKTVTERVIAANRAKAKASTGPRSDRGKSNSSQNALQHSILAKKVVFPTDEERTAFKSLLQSCNAEFAPEGFLEHLLVEEIVTDVWKIQIAIGFETRELSARDDVRDQVDGVFHSNLKLPISDWDLPIDKSWECERIVVRAVAGTDTSRSSASRGPAVFQNQVINAVQKLQNHNSQEAGQLEVEAVLGSSLEKMIRYQSALKRDLYRAIETLRNVKAEKRERQGVTPNT